MFRACAALSTATAANTMAKSKQAKTAKSRDFVQQPTPPAQDDDESEDVEMSDESEAEIVVDGELEKDETEEELERLVFGDSTAFRDGLRDFDPEAGDEDIAGYDATTGLEGLDDAQVGQTYLWAYEAL